ncbi:MAG: pantoate--beta-alanine ligase, partial [Candidatus Aminicenantes bacterium]|nr:pantoate--beta-alanine ligase [Candidatus Aminicenantes bacterium]
QDKLCGKTRPAHFRGVCTVVLKLFNIVHPAIAFFGQKDAQQAIILKRMAEDLNLDVKIEVLPIIRDKDGLALSSRNVYLDPKQRQAALVLYRSLKQVKDMFDRGVRESKKLLKVIKEKIEAEPMVKLDYAEIVDPRYLEPVSLIENQALIALAVFIGRIRLIDNIIVSTEEKE